MVDSNVIEEKDSLEGYEFVDENAHRSFLCALDKIVSSQDELRDFIYDMRNNAYCKLKFQKDSFKQKYRRNEQWQSIAEASPVAVTR